MKEALIRAKNDDQNNGGCLSEIKNKYSKQNENISNLEASISNFMSLAYTIDDLNEKLEEEKDKRNEQYFKGCWRCFCCCSSCCGCSCINEQYKDNEEIKKKIEDSEDKEKEYNEKLEKIRNFYIDKSKRISFSDKEKNDIKIFYIASFCHFFSMTEVHGILYALLSEIQRTLFKPNFMTNLSFLDFFDDLTISSFNDTSQININYFSSILSLYFISKVTSKYAYLISILVISISIISLKFFHFTKKEEIECKEYGNFEFVYLILSYFIIYLFGGFICLFPYYILEDFYEGKYNPNGVFFLNIILLISICAKNILHFFWKTKNILFFYYYSL